MSTTPEKAQELMRSVHADEIDATVEVLTLACIAYHITSTQSESEGAEAAFLGQASEPVAQAVLVSPADLEAARNALEKAYTDCELPEGHFLHTASDADIADVLLNPADWGAFDVVHAKRLASERNIDLAAVAAQQQETKSRLAKGKPAAHWLLALAWLAILASIYTSYIWGNDWKVNMGCICAAILGETYANSCLEDDVTHVYDRASRQHGRLLTVVAVSNIIVMRYLV
jgi:hypothetical protein